MNRVTSWVNQRAGVALVAVALLTGGLYAAQVYEVRSQTQCQAGYNQAFNVQLTERSRVTRNLLEGVGDAFLQKPTTDKAEQARRNAAFLKLFEDYKAEVAVPLPPIPDC